MWISALCNQYIGELRNISHLSNRKFLNIGYSGNNFRVCNGLYHLYGSEILSN